ncbi:hypothetical protein NC651_032899 [Populus alba x Populus x berolinensis]|nr:hypothetical protein NC651_032899 [Populus alba x Populus x berolinensis]
MLMNLRINPDYLNGRRSWMKNMGARSIGSDKSRALMTRMLNLLQQLQP